jgi:hypothetical protein
MMWRKGGARVPDISAFFPLHCYGWGLCVRVSPTYAITLVEIA